MKISIFCLSVALAVATQLPVSYGFNAPLSEYFTCRDGTKIPAYMHCDGVPQCRDRSDESPMNCSNHSCPPATYRCPDGTCINVYTQCNEIISNSGEFDEDRDIRWNRHITRKRFHGQKSCVLPERPLNGFYKVAGSNFEPKPGETVDTYVKITCYPGYTLFGPKLVFCSDGRWDVEKFPTCSVSCKLPKSDVIEYQCMVSGSNGFKGARHCNDYEPDSTIVMPKCRTPGYYSPMEPLRNMVCFNGEWDYVPKCLPDCAKPYKKSMMLDGPADRRDLPWSAIIYKKVRGEYIFICSGSLISNIHVMSAAYCFWSSTNRKLPAESFTIALGKLSTEWNDPNDFFYAQISEVLEIELAERFYGSTLYFQEDMAVVTLETPVTINKFVHHTCISFRHDQKEQLLQAGNIGKMGRWVYTEDNTGSREKRLHVVHLPYVPYQKCVRGTPELFASYLVADKFCAGYIDKYSSTLSKGDSGAGLTFPVTKNGMTREYVMGVASSSAPHQVRSYPSFTLVYNHAGLIARHLFGNEIII